MFETNSSSTHALCLTKNSVLNQRMEYLNLDTDQFGWDFDKIETPEEKANYLLTAIYDTKRFELIDFIKQILSKNDIAWYITYPKMTEYSNGYKKYDCYIDHGNETVDMLNAICKDEDSLMRYLFSSESFVLTGNDNSDKKVIVDVPYEHEVIWKGN